jgi:hypothetical protein
MMSPAMHSTMHGPAAGPFYGPPPCDDDMRFSSIYIFRFNPEALAFVPGAFTHPFPPEARYYDGCSIPPNVSIPFNAGHRRMNPAAPAFVPAIALHGQLLELIEETNRLNQSMGTIPVSHPNQEQPVHRNPGQQYNQFVGMNMGHYPYDNMGYLDYPNDMFYSGHFEYPQQRFFAGSSTQPVFALDPQHALHHSGLAAGKKFCHVCCAAGLTSSKTGTMKTKKGRKKGYKCKGKGRFTEYWGGNGDDGGEW